MKLLLPCICLLAILSSCVPKTKYDQLLMSNSRTQTQRDSLLDLSSQLPGIKASLGSTTTEVKQMKKKLEQTSSENIAIKNQYNEMEERFKELSEQNNSLLSNSSSQVQSLTSELSARERKLDAREQELEMLYEDLDKKKLALSEVNNNYAEYEIRIKQLEAAIAKNKLQLDALRTKINSALKGFNAADLQVTARNGKIYVSLSQGLLFASGSDQIDERGLDAIAKLGGVLKKNPDLFINVEGHTDADGTASKNWDLSVRRATSVVKQLSNAGCDPKQITASGRAYFDPIAENDTAENKSKNRRTEIIIAPKLDELIQLMEN